MGLIKEKIIQTYGREPETLDELAQCVIKIIESKVNGAHYDPNYKGTRYRVLGLAWDISHSSLVSNSHSAPEGRLENWCGRIPDEPRGYPGWEGRVWIRLEEESKGAGSHMFHETLTHPGSGGSGDYSGPWREINIASFDLKYNVKKKPAAKSRIHLYSYDYRIYDLDWPLIAKWVEKQKMWNEIKGHKVNLTHSFCWEDPATLAADDELLKEYAVIKSNLK
jgi:hypothetical protein